MIRVETRLALSARPSIGRIVSQWAAVARQRRALAQLDETALRDVGINPREAASEAARPFWDAPSNWRI
ncbi:DUF1127 domain-containing protein [Thalassococcus lentus]|uniref:DUF1127 domain-containing protein n=1 Tax=Thalassococcus lentus TaxID=1210524 RepID=A0ABT4XXS8_9RHOB|nr:DUF1127 domain-containing protein [Thalassococcus lentus]MDA7426771.1 DUF1127 domain-containing protein [Thalassococcus lentus]